MSTGTGWRKPSIKVIRGKVGLLELAKQLGNVSQACKTMGYSRDSFYRFNELYDTGGEMALQELTRRKPLWANRTPAQVEAIILDPTMAQPRSGRCGLPTKCVSLAIRSRRQACAAWQRHDRETMKKRLKALEAKVAQEGIILTESQLDALEQLSRP